MVGVAGIRGIVGKDLTPEAVARYAAAFGIWAAAGEGGTGKGPRRRRPAVVLGRDARTSGPMFARAASAGLMSVGCDVIDLGLVTTPTAQLAVEHHRAAGGIVLTASHNPIEWNALKFVGPDGIFLDAEGGAQVVTLAADGRLERAGFGALGDIAPDDAATARHLAAVLRLKAVDVRGIRRSRSARAHRVGIQGRGDELGARRALPTAARAAPRAPRGAGQAGAAQQGGLGARGRSRC